MREEVKHARLRVLDFAGVNLRFSPGSCSHVSHLRRLTFSNSPFRRQCGVDCPDRGTRGGGAVAVDGGYGARVRGRGHALAVWAPGALGSTQGTDRVSRDTVGWWPWSPARCLFLF